MTRIRNVTDLPPAMRDQVLKNTGRFPIFHPAGVDKPRKYRNVPTVEDGQRFDSKLEAACYRELKLRVAAGDLKWFTRQVSWELEGGVKVRIDFLAERASGGTEAIDAKGVLTQVAKNKYKQLKARHGIDVILWKGDVKGRGLWAFAP